jgi:serine protease Do
MKGQLIGIVNAKYSSNGAEGLGFAIPMNTVSEVYEDLITYGYVRGRADHGLSIIQQYTLRPGFYGYILYIVESKYNSDILYGDRLVAINGQTPESAEAAYAMLDGLDIGDTVEITVYRGSEEITVELTVSEYHP